MRIKFTVPAVPIAQPRQRHAVRGNHAVNYLPSKHPVHAFKATCRIAAAEVMTGGPMTGAVMLTLQIVLPRPKSITRKTRPNPRLRHAKKPDVDNLVKSIKDALTGLVWVDDSQVAELHASKWVAAATEQPCVIVDVMQVAE
jgi:Holliday junction resolvase RusA-like endonuclease